MRFRFCALTLKDGQNVQFLLQPLTKLQLLFVHLDQILQPSDKAPCLSIRPLFQFPLLQGDVVHGPSLFLDEQLHLGDFLVHVGEFVSDEVVDVGVGGVKVGGGDGG